jgi:hypothetical protein
LRLRLHRLGRQTLALLQVRGLSARDAERCSGAVPATDLWSNVPLDDGIDEPVELDIVNEWQCLKKRNGDKKLRTPQSAADKSAMEETCWNGSRAAAGRATTDNRQQMVSRPKHIVVVRSNRPHAPRAAFTCSGSTGLGGWHVSNRCAFGTSVSSMVSKNPYTKTAVE